MRSTSSGLKCSPPCSRISPRVSALARYDLVTGSLGQPKHAGICSIAQLKVLSRILPDTYSRDFASLCHLHISKLLLVINWHCYIYKSASFDIIVVLHSIRTHLIGTCLKSVYMVPMLSSNSSCKVLSAACGPSEYRTYVSWHALYVTVP